MIENKYFVGSLLIKLETKTKCVCSQLLILQIAVANIIDVGRFGVHFCNAGEMLAYILILISIAKDDSIG